ncbi:MAG: hypothetical protein WEB03_06275 [Nitriliruptor sp.]|uniref:hypothetical protein n=1 Tax=Nitriliruptor sp. TaxID=2448056 RepID=UPI0034A0ABC3
MQGDTVSPETANDWRAQGLTPEEWDPQRDWLVVVSHSCDLAAQDLEAEPWAEIMRGVPAEGPANGNLTWGKNPRKLQVEAASSAEVVTLSVHDRVRIPKQALEGHAPDQGRRLPAKDRTGLARWLGKRYFRAAFPDAFNDRVRPVTGRIRDFLKKPGGTVLAGLYLILNSDDELSPDDAYRVVLRGVMEVKDHNDEELKALALQAMKAVAGLLGQLPDVELEVWELVSTAEMSLDDLNYFQRWDYDDLSDRADGAARAVDP